MSTILLEIYIFSVEYSDSSINKDSLSLYTKLEYEKYCYIVKSNLIFVSSNIHINLVFDIKNIIELICFHFYMSLVRNMAK